VGEAVFIWAVKPKDRIAVQAAALTAAGGMHRRRPRVTRRLAIELAQGEASVFERVDGSVQVHCAAGSLWITHDGDCKDVVLGPQQSYCAEREQAMHLFALAPCVIELEFEDEVLAPA
jgi:hypothetical protein